MLVSTRGVDVVFLFDVSQSMDARDIAPEAFGKSCSPDGSLDCPYRIESLPYSSRGSTKGRTNRDFASYNCSGANEGGAEEAYLLVVDDYGTLSVTVAPWASASTRDGRGAGLTTTRFKKGAAAGATTEPTLPVAETPTTPTVTSAASPRSENGAAEKGLKPNIAPLLYWVKLGKDTAFLSLRLGQATRPSLLHRAGL